ncbi:hypothetical protein FPV67DRAFT_1496629 [Lyophyllum atratum]|nr:hypothetical protein FPV67DRAFT_1496629 [Lyophyllum atratum]
MRLSLKLYTNSSFKAITETLYSFSWSEFTGNKNVIRNLELLPSSRSQREARQAVLHELQEVVQKHWNGRLSVTDISMYRYAYDAKEAPVEFALVDDSRDIHDISTLPSIYNPSLVAQTLLEAGCMGSFYRSYAAKINAIQNRPPGAYDYSAPWPNYKERKEADELPYPVQLFMTSLPSGNSLSVSLTLPGPHVIRLYTLLCQVYEDDVAKQLLTIVWAWTRSLNLTQFSATALAIMTGRFLQDSPKGPIQESLKGFFKYWFSADWTSFEIVTIHDKHFRLSEPLRTRRILPYKEEPRRKLPGVEDWYPEPRSWATQPLIVQDPFVATKNHAEGVSSSELTRFRLNCRYAFETLYATGFPLESEIKSSPPAPAPVTQGSTLLEGHLAERIVQPLGNGSLHDSHPNSSDVPSIGHDLDYALAHKYLDLPSSVRRRRSETLKLVQDTIQEQYGKRYTVETFGSARYDVSLPKSDLDLVIIDPERQHGFEPDCQLPPIYNVRKLARILREAGFREIQCIPNAAVPIVKFKDPRTRLECDINVNERLGLLNSDLLKAYCDASPLLRPMLMLIKLWAKPLGLNSPSPFREVPSFSSYALALMTIGFLQTRGLLPNLQGNLPPLQPDIKGSIFRTRKFKGKSALCDVRYQPKLLDWHPRSNTTLRMAVQDWFSYWCHEFRYADQIVSIRHGGLLDSPVQTPPDWAGDPVGVEKPTVSSRTPPHAVHVLDPFIETKNVTQAIGPKVLKRFIDECQAALEDMKAGVKLSVLIHERDRKSPQLKYLEGILGETFEEESETTSVINGRYLHLLGTRLFGIGVRRATVVVRKSGNRQC